MQIDEKTKRELWFWHFTSVLYANGIITEAQRMELEKKIGGIS